MDSVIVILILTTTQAIRQPSFQCLIFIRHYEMFCFEMDTFDMSVSISMHTQVR